MPGPINPDSHQHRPVSTQEGGSTSQPKSSENLGGWQKAKSYALSFFGHSFSAKHVGKYTGEKGTAGVSSAIDLTKVKTDAVKKGSETASGSLEKMMTTKNRICRWFGSFSFTGKSAEKAADISVQKQIERQSSYGGATSSLLGWKGKTKVTTLKREVLTVEEAKGRMQLNKSTKLGLQAEAKKAASNVHDLTCQREAKKDQRDQCQGLSEMHKGIADTSKEKAKYIRSGKGLFQKGMETVGLSAGDARSQTIPEAKDEVKTAEKNLATAQKSGKGTDLCESKLKRAKDHLQALETSATRHENRAKEADNTSKEYEKKAAELKKEIASLKTQINEETSENSGLQAINQQLEAVEAEATDLRGGVVFKERDLGKQETASEAVKSAITGTFSNADTIPAHKREFVVTMYSEKDPDGHSVSVDLNSFTIDDQDTGVHKFREKAYESNKNYKGDSRTDGVKESQDQAVGEMLKALDDKYAQLGYTHVKVEYLDKKSYEKKVA